MNEVQSSSTGMISEQPTAKEQVTTFSDDSSIVSVNVGSTSISASEMSISEKNTLTSILSRPTRISAGKWSSSVSALPTVPVDMSAIPSLISVDLPGAIYSNNISIRDKLANFSLLKSDLKVRLQVNAAPYQQGKLLMVWRPMKNVMDVSRNYTFNSKAGLSGFPHVEIDSSAGNTAELSIPYASALAAMMLSDPDTQYLGTLEVYVLNQLRTATMPTTASYTLWAWFDNPVVSCPTDVAASLPVMLESRAEGSHSIVHQFGTLMEAQMMDQGDQRTVISELPARGYTHVDNSGCGVTLAANQVVTSAPPIMSDDTVASICEKEAILDTFSWATSDAVDKLLWRTYSNPRASATSADGRLGFLTPLAFMSTLFNYWRGTIRYRFSVAKTVYHAGRVRIQFSPISGAGARQSSDNAYSVVWDLRETSEITIDVPYVAASPMLSLPSGLAPVVGGGNISNVGQLSVFVINDLIASETVSDTVDINVWVSSPDMDFRVNRLGAVDLSPNASYVVPLPPIPEMMEAQILTDDTPAPTAGHMIMPIKTGVPPSFVSDDSITSLSEMAKRCTMWAFTSNSQEAYTIPSPFFIPPSEQNAVPSPVLQNNCLIDYLSQVFAFVSGGQKWKFCSGRASEDVLLTSGSITTREAAPSIGVPGLPIREQTTFQNARLNNVLEVSVPYYSNAIALPKDDNGVFNTVYHSALQVASVGAPTTGSNVFFLLRGGDHDFKFSYFMSAPAVTYT